MVCALYSSPCPINYLNDSRTAHKVESLRLRRSLLQYVTQMAHFDLVEIKLHSIDRELFSRLYLISADPLWSFKNLCDSIYGMEMKPPLERWRRQKGKKRAWEVDGEGTTKSASPSLEGNIFSNIMHLEIFSFTRGCLFSEIARLFQLSFWYHKILRRYCQTFIFISLLSRVEATFDRSRRFSRFSILCLLRR